MKRNILFCASEMTPFAKTGGLADVAAALPKHLKKLGHNVKVVLPRYYTINKNDLEFVIGNIGVDMGPLGTLWCGAYKSTYEGVEVYFIDYEIFFGRDNLYTDYNGYSYPDNDARFIFFSKAALELARVLDFKPDIVHANDWHTAAQPILLNTLLRNDPFFQKTASVFTIHNLQHQGVFAKSAFEYLGIGWEHFNMYEMEALGALNLMKGAIYHADKITTVSPKYAQEIQTPQFGFGLQEHIKAHAYKLFGILNGVDYDEWNPKTDPFIAKNYDIDDLSGKKVCKIDLQKSFNLAQKDDIPLIGFVGRFAQQKGIELIAAAMHELVHLPLQMVFLGSGEKWAEGFFQDIANRYENVGCYVGYSNELAHKIEAGSDLFLMPSLFEPCGLNQIYSLRYGTLPIVRAVGGLDDTIQNYEPHTKTGDGFKFYDATKEALIGTVRWAVDTWLHDKEGIDTMIQTAMSKRFDWQRSAKEYERVYELAMETKK
ncbi:starch synthase [Nitratiruptor sp. YY08-26]|uniref:glycogen synthase GlgA n=1 Tax=unclassified Nitratiruptor TaxID=2624044 RepID=UPI0019167680|nr:MULTISPECIES: glycogen synthase GlgA [unclassified Nitratiruptor]BCD62264.1 starch synthase [Nitratiruptor sp. YY08-13]BCD66200.1 starch synthase [Nitratiruptor sp. YY08-26]